MRCAWQVDGTSLQCTKRSKKSMFITLKQASKQTGLRTVTLRKYADNNVIHSIRLPSGQRRVVVSCLLCERESVVCYARVSSRRQSDDLIRQVARLKEAYPESEVVQDIASGLNFKRKGLNSVLVRLLRGDKLTVVVTHCRLFAGLGYKHAVSYNGGKLMVFNNGHIKPWWK